MDILIVEDDDSIAEPLERGLTREGFNTLRVSTGAAALSSSPVDVVLLAVSYTHLTLPTILRV